MLIKKTIQKEIKRRKFFFNNYIEYFVYYSIFKNKKLSFVIRQKAYKQLKKFRRFSLSKQNKYCLITSRIRGNYSKFKMSRHLLKHLASQGRINGFFKI